MESATKPDPRSQPVARKSTRVIASIIDSLAIGLSAPLVAIAISAATGNGWRLDVESRVGLVVGYVLTVLNDVVWVRHSGKTLGKSISGIRIVQMTQMGSPPDWRQTLIRCAVKWAVIFMPLAYLPGMFGEAFATLELLAPLAVLVMVLADRIARGPHDKLAGTIVVVDVGVGVGGS
jgi:uncharacterized RDD family membrane protein YckC